MRTRASSRWIAFAFGFVLLLCAGLVFAWSIFAAPIELDLNVTREQTSLVFPFSLSVSIGGQMIAGIIQKRFSVKYNFLLAAVLFAAGFSLTAMVQSIGQLYLFYGCMVGLAIGILYNSVLSNVILHFPDKSSLITGLLLMGFGLGSMVLGTLAAGLIVSAGWRTVFWLFASLYTVLSLLGAVVITRPTLAEHATAQKEEGPQIPTSVMAKSVHFRLFFLWSTLLVGGAMVVSGHAALAVSDLQAGPFLAAAAVGVTSIANVLSRLVVGYGYKRWGNKRLTWGLTLLATFSSLICFLGYAGNSLVLMFAGYALLGAVNGGSAIFSNAYILAEYGSQHFALNIAVTNVYMAVASFLGPAVAGFIRTRYHSYHYAFLFMLGMSALSALVLVLYNRSTQKQNVPPLSDSL